MTRPTPRLLGLVASALLAVACVPDAPQVALGPVDGRDLPAADTGRVVVGAMAPDFALESYVDGVIRLSEFRGKKDVILVFYRGYW